MRIVNDKFTPAMEGLLLDIFEQLSDRPLPPMPHGTQVIPCVDGSIAGTAAREVVTQNGARARIVQQKDGRSIAKALGITIGFQSLDEGILGTALFLDALGK